MWRPSTGGPAQDVAIKTLKLSAKEADRIKFLQEGAIMGQFRHTNVVTLHGIVREEQKVSVSLGGTAIDIIMILPYKDHPFSTFLHVD